MEEEVCIASSVEGVDMAHAEERVSGGSSNMDPQLGGHMAVVCTLVEGVVADTGLEGAEPGIEVEGVDIGIVVDTEVEGVVADTGV